MTSSVRSPAPLDTHSQPQRTPSSPAEVKGSTRRNVLATLGLSALAGAVAKLTGVSDQAVRSLGDRAEFLRNHIRDFHNTAFISDRKHKNTAYYESRSITDPAEMQALSQSLTNLDIVVELFRAGTVSETDILGHVLGSIERIVTEPGVFLVQTPTRDGQPLGGIGEEHLDHGTDLATGFFQTFLADSNNPQKKQFNLTINPRPQGGGYIFSFDRDGHNYTIEAGFRIN